MLSFLEGEKYFKPIFSESAKPDLFNLKYDVSKNIISCIEGEWKLIINELWSTKELYNIVKDSKEKSNLINDKDIYIKLKSLIDKHLKLEEIKRYSSNY